MCLAIPAIVIELDEPNLAVIEIGGVRKQVSLMLVDDVAVGDYVLVHAGFAIDKVDEGEAQKTMDLLQELARLEQLRRRDGGRDQDPRARDALLQPQRVEGGDLEDPPDRLDRAQAREVVGARDGLLPPAPQPTQAPGLGGLLLPCGAVP